jgi:hypothetical protein
VRRYGIGSGGEERRARCVPGKFGRVEKGFRLSTEMQQALEHFRDVADKCLGNVKE